MPHQFDISHHLGGIILNFKRREGQGDMRQGMRRHEWVCVHSLKLPKPATVKIDIMHNGPQTPVFSAEVLICHRIKSRLTSLSSCQISPHSQGYSGPRPSLDTSRQSGESSVLHAELFIPGASSGSFFCPYSKQCPSVAPDPVLALYLALVLAPEFPQHISYPFQNSSFLLEAEILLPTIMFPGAGCPPGLSVSRTTFL